MLIQGVRDFSIHGALTDCVVIEAKKTASTNRADGSCVLLLGGLIAVRSPSKG